mmetsp:Transcript_67840/g.126737  ORF Transcript_67840/g.126737 Transcript_67840/m.126737 type:complete len:447 (+) Transcript_67840:103-1443(+)
MDPSETDPLLDALNAAWADINVSTSYDVVYTIGASSFHLTSPDGRLEVTALTTPKAIRAALASCATHVVVEKEADVFNLRTTDGLLKGIESRSIVVNGDGSQVRALCKEMAAYESLATSALRQKASQMGVQLLSDVPGEKTDLSMPKDMLPEGSNTAIVAADGQMYAAAFEGAMVGHLWQWIHFSAASSFMGNMAQTNYTAANCWLDTITWHARTTQAIIQPQTYMWGAVTGLGMRLKAFGSQDFLLNSDEDVLLTADDASLILRLCVRGQNPPEWVNGSLLGAAMRAAWLGTPPPGEGPAVSSEDIIYEPSSDKLRVLPSDEKARAQVFRKIHQKQQSGKQQGSSGMAPSDPPAHLIAGSWDEWTAHEFPWCAERECFVFRVRVGKSGSESFQICKGKPTGRRVKSGGKTWKIGLRDPGAMYEVRMFIKDTGAAKKVEWEKLREE